MKVDIAEEYGLQLEYESFYIGNAIQFLENHLEDLKNCPEDNESRLLVVERIIKHLKFGTIGGRVFSMESGYKKHEAKVAEAWKNFREEHPEFYR